MHIIIHPTQVMVTDYPIYWDYLFQQIHLATTYEINSELLIKQGNCPSHNRQEVYLWKSLCIVGTQYLSEK